MTEKLLVYNYEGRFYMSIIGEFKDIIKNYAISKIKTGEHWIKKNINVVIAFVSLVLIIVWMLLFIKYPERFAVNIYFLAINTLLIVYLIETEKSKESVNMERVILISSILFCCICCLMEYINQITLPFIILSLLSVYLINLLKVFSKFLNIHKVFFIFTLIFATILGSISVKYWQILALLFLSTKTYLSYISILYENKKNTNSNIKENNRKYKLKLKKIEVDLDIIDFLTYISISVSDCLYELNVVNCISKFLFDEKYELEFNYTIEILFYVKYKLELYFIKGFLTIVIFTILYIVIVILKKYINKKYPRIKENLADKIFDD